MIDMAKMSDAMVKGLREIAAERQGADVHGRTINALRARFLIKPGTESGTYEITPSGRAALDGIDRAEREQAERLERASRPVPAQIGEPSAARPLMLDTDMGNGCECDQDGCKVCFPESAPEPSSRAELIGVAKDAQRGIRPALDMLRTLAEHAGYVMTAGGWVRHAASMDNPEHRGRVAHGWRELAGCVLDAEAYTTQDVIVKALGWETPEASVPQAWIDQLVTLLNADARIVRRTGSEWTYHGGAPGLSFNQARLHDAAREAIRLGIAEALPPTPGQGVIRLALKRN